MLGELMVRRRFAPLFWCQFFSAFTDNFVKNVLVILILFKIGGEGAGVLVTLAGAVFILPFFILSGVGGEMADRYDKAFVARRLKLVEIAVAAIAAVGFALSSVPILFVALFGFGVIGALFGPIKYGILPDHLAREELPAGNALVEGATFLAILTGTIAGGIAAAAGDTLSVVTLMMAFAVACWLASLFIPPTGEAAPTLRVDPNIVRSTVGLLKDLWADARLWRGALVVSWFWLIGAVALALMPTLVKDTIGGTEEVVTAFLAVFSVAIAVGSLLAAWLAAGRIILLPTPVAALLMGVFAIDLGIAGSSAVPAMPPVGIEAFFQRPPGLRIAIDLAGLAVAGGLFIVPYFAAVQAWAGADRRARVIAGVNVLNAAFMTVGALVTAALQGAGVSVPLLFSVLGVLNLLAGVLIFRTLPTSALKDFLSILFRAVYRVEVKGRENLARAGRHAIITVDHVSHLDGLLMLSLLDQRPILAVDPAIAARWWIRPFLRSLGAKAITPTAVRTLVKAVEAGEPVVMLAGLRSGLSAEAMRTCETASFIADRAGAAIVPVRIEGLEASLFSRLPRSEVRAPSCRGVRVTALAPVMLAGDPVLHRRARRRASGTALHGLMSDLVFETAATDRTLLEAVIAAAAVHGRRRIVVQDAAGALSYGKLLREAVLVGRGLLPLAAEGQAVGVMLPNGTEATVTILGLMSAGRLPALIDAEAGAGSILAACRAAEIGTLITQRRFVEKARLHSLLEALSDSVSVRYLEDLRASIGLFGRIRSVMTAETPIVARRPDDPVLVLFTAGSQGPPNGVVFSSRNLLANAAQISARMERSRGDTMFSTAPLTNAFGLSLGMVLPLVGGLPVYLHAGPHDGAPELICRGKATILLGGETFLESCAGAARPHELTSLRTVLAGAEATKESTRHLLMEKFGLRVLESYGTAETLVVALNTPTSNRFGTVGRLLPGMEARLETLPGLDIGGRLLLKGPNIMLGSTAGDGPGTLNTPPEGWHDTGDVAAVKDGHLTIVERASRFARIAGELVPLAAVEALASEIWPQAVAAAIAMPDARKGERIVVVTSQPKAKRAMFHAHIRERGADDRLTPSAIIVAQVPKRAGGKIDYAAVSRLAQDKIRISTTRGEPSSAEAVA